MPGGLGLVVAQPREARWLEPLGGKAAVEVCGIGERRAGAAAARLLDAGATALASWGMAAGLDPGLPPGTVLLPRAVVLPNGGRIEADADWHDRLRSALTGRLRLSCDPLAHSATLLETAAAKAGLRQRSNAAAADMESGAVARAADERGAPWLIVRVVLDPARARLPRAVICGIEEYGRPRPAAFLSLLVRSPRDWPTMLRLALWSRAAARAMRRLRSLAGPDLMS